MTRSVITLMSAVAKVGFGPKVPLRTLSTTPLKEFKSTTPTSFDPTKPLEEVQKTEAGYWDGFNHAVPMEALGCSDAEEE